VIEIKKSGLELRPDFFLCTSGEIKFRRKKKSKIFSGDENSIEGFSREG
jgi:hypothetical protein